MLASANFLESSSGSVPGRERTSLFDQFIMKMNDSKARMRLYALCAAGLYVIAILLMMGIAILFCLCSEADAFVAANFPLFWPDSSKLAFLVLGPMLDLKLLLMYTRVFRARLIYTIVAALLVQVFVYSSIAGYFFGVRQKVFRDGNNFYLNRRQPCRKSPAPAFDEERNEPLMGS